MKNNMKLVKISTHILGFTHLSPDVWYSATVLNEHMFSIATSHGPMNVSKSNCTRIKDMPYDD